MEGRAERIPQPLGRLEFFARAFDPGVVQADNNLFWAILSDGSLDNGPKERARIPSTAVEELVIGAPVLMLAIVKTDRARVIVRRPNPQSRPSASAIARAWVLC